MSLGEILDRTAELYRNNFLLFAGISSIYAGAVLATSMFFLGIQAIVGAPDPKHPFQAWIITAAIVQLLVVFVLAGLAMAANNRAVAWVYLGEKATIKGAYQSILPKAGRYLWVMLLAALIAWVPFALAYVVIFFGIILGKSNQVLMVVAILVGVLGVLGGFIYGVLMSLRYSLAVPAIIVEGLKAGQALKRSAQLSKGSRGRIFVLGLLTTAITFALVGITQFPFILMAFKHPGVPLSIGIQALQQILSFFTTTFIGPIYATALTLFYYDQRIRKEGYDIEWMMQAAGLEAQPVQVAAGAAEPVEEPTTDSPEAPTEA
jgi:hypothetical protein